MVCESGDRCLFWAGCVSLNATCEIGGRRFRSNWFLMVELQTRTLPIPVFQTGVAYPSITSPQTYPDGSTIFISGFDLPSKASERVLMSDSGLSAHNIDLMRTIRLTEEACVVCAFSRTRSPAVTGSVWCEPIRGTGTIASRQSAISRLWTTERSNVPSMP